MSERKRLQFTDTMIRVDSLDDSARFWIDVIGMKEIERGKSGIMLEDPDTKQRVTLIDTSINSRYAFAIATDDMQKTLGLFRENGVSVPEPTESDSGLEYALCRDPSGIPVMVYATD
jgi:catechol 2,3-dioxygenase-like lactoylglutathione lyase family enzyme